MHINQNITADHIAIHRAIHDIALPDHVWMSNGTTLPVERRNKLAFVRYKDGNKIITFIQQNPNTSSVHAQRARRGMRITWGIRDAGSWIYIDDDVANEFTNRLNKKSA